MIEEKVNNIDSIPLSEIISLVDKFITGEITEEQMSDYGNNMTIRSYIPIMEKMTIVMSIIIQHIYTDTSTHEIKVAELYRNLFFYGMLSGYAFIDCKDRNLITYENYDKLYPIFAPFILSYCKDDYELLKEFLHDSIDMYGTNGLIEALDNITIDSLNESLQNNIEFIKELKENKEMISNLKDMAQINDPLVADIIETMRKTGMRE